MIISILEILFLFCIAVFDHVYYRHTVLLKNSSKKEKLKFLSKIIDIAVVITYIVWIYYYFIDNIFHSMIKNWVSWEHFFQFIPTSKQIMLGSLILLYLILIVFFVWPSFRSFILFKLHLDPRRYIHRIAVWWMVASLIGYLSARFFSLPLNTDPNFKYESIAMLFKIMEFLSILLAVGTGIRRNVKETMARLGLSRIPTWKDIFAVIAFLSLTILAPMLTNYFFHGAVRLRISLDIVLNIWIIFLAVGIEKITNGLGIYQKHTLENKLIATSPIQMFFFPITLFIIIFIKYVIPADKIIISEENLSMNLLTIVTLVIIGPMVEELFFRGALQPRVGIWVTSVVFALSHTQYDLKNILEVFMASLAYGWIARRYSIWLSIGAHIIDNLLYVIVILTGLQKHF